MAHYGLTLQHVFRISTSDYTCCGVDVNSKYLEENTSKINARAAWECFVTLTIIVPNVPFSIQDNSPSINCSIDINIIIIMQIAETKDISTMKSISVPSGGGGGRGGHSEGKPVVGAKHKLHQSCYKYKI